MVEGPEEGTVCWAELLAETTARLERAGSESAASDARRIVEEASGAEPSEFHTVLASPATVRGVASLDSMVARRERGEPLQYVVGRWGFRYLDLMVDTRVLIPRPETEEVAGLAIDEVTARSVERQPLVADLGTGSGAIALSIASECQSARVLATDVSAEALQVARANLTGIGRAASRVSLHHGSWFDALPASVKGSIDVLVSNPPYVTDTEDLPAVVADWEPPTALRAGGDGLDDLTEIVAGADTSVRACGQDYIDELEALDNEIRATLSAVPDNARYLVTNHDAFGYFAARYDFEVVGTVIPSLSTLAETNPADLADLAAIIEELDIPAIFAEYQAADTEANALAEVLPGVSVATLDSGSLRDSNDSYITFMRRNTQVIAEALG